MVEDVDGGGEYRLRRVAEMRSASRDDPATIKSLVWREFDSRAL